MSSILEISERQLVDSAPEDGYLRSSSQQSSSHSALNVPATELARSGFFTVLDVAVEYQVPYISIKQIGLPNAFESQGIHYGYSVGTGYSARVVRHLTEHDVGQIKQGTVVALKQYLPKDATFGQGEGETENTVFQAVRREIKALCHPWLRNHENVCRVLYVGWHNKSIYPILALELATYGTLEDAMTAPGIGLSWLQKMNITIDIISAIQAVHSVSMIHGDIKPGNIILQHHETRQVVAKIIDLAGSRDLYDDCALEFRPGMGTELWAPPEVCLGSPNVNWYKADAYSLGLLIASIWARPPTWVQRKLDSCILERFVPRNMSKEEKRDRLIILKTHTDINIQGVMQQCWSDVPCINPIILTTLSADASWRLDGTKLGSLMLPMLCWKVPRTVPGFGDSPGVSRNAPAAFTVWSANFVNSSRDVHDMVFSRLHAESAPIRRLIGPISLQFVPSIESQATNEECIIQRAYICLKTLESTVKKQFGLQAASCGLLAYEYALCHYMGLGASHSLEVFNDHINAAALSGYYTDFHLSLVAKTIPLDDALESLRALFLVIGAIVGKKTAICSLKHSFPELHRSTLRSLSLRREISGHRKTSASSGLVQWLKEAAGLPISNPSLFTLKECFETHNCQRISEILATGEFDASITYGGLGIFHYLTYLEDNEAVALATLCLERGGALSHRAPDNSWTCLKTTKTPPSQTALAWAWAYGMDRYFDELLKLHMQKDIPITDYHMLLWSASEHFDRKSLQKLLQLVDSHPHLLNQGSDWLPLQVRILKLRTILYHR
ncbi:hypothetical protein H9Q69_005345 [Fusarium xylarioides]|nr:hypothetical protein H9Q69_005345 [Fusarium xylarioides]